MAGNAEEPGTTLGVTESGVESVYVLRDVLRANRTIYVRLDGSDSNKGTVNTTAGAYRTIAKALERLSLTVLNGFTFTIQVGPGLYNAPVDFRMAWGGGGRVVVRGDVAAPANVVIVTTGADAFKISCVLPSVLTIEGFKLVTRTSGCGIFHNGGGTLNLGVMDYGECAGDHVHAEGPAAYVKMVSPYSITGSAGNAHILADSGAMLDADDITATATSNISFTTFAVATRKSGINTVAAYVASGVTGTRYYVDGNSIIFTSGAGASLFPGNAAGGIASGGQYI